MPNGMVKCLRTWEYGETWASGALTRGILQVPCKKEAGEKRLTKDWPKAERAWVRVVPMGLERRLMTS